MHSLRVLLATVFFAGVLQPLAAQTAQPNLNPRALLLQGPTQSGETLDKVVDAKCNKLKAELADKEKNKNNVFDLKRYIAELCG